MQYSAVALDLENAVERKEIDRLIEALSYLKGIKSITPVISERYKELIDADNKRREEFRSGNVHYDHFRSELSKDDIEALRHRATGIQPIETFSGSISEFLKRKEEAENYTYSVTNREVNLLIKEIDRLNKRVTELLNGKSA